VIPFSEELDPNTIKRIATLAIIMNKTIG